MNLSTAAILVAWLCFLVAGPASAQAVVDANTATRVELETITGIGPALSERIVAERRKAPFRSLEDFRERVRGVGDAKLRKMRDSGLVVGPAHLLPGTETIVGEPRSAPARKLAHRPRAEDRKSGGGRWPERGTATIVGMPRD